MKEILVTIEFSEIALTITFDARMLPHNSSYNNKQSNFYNVYHKLQKINIIIFLTMLQYCFRVTFYVGSPNIFRKRCYYSPKEGGRNKICSKHSLSESNTKQMIFFIVPSRPALFPLRSLVSSCTTRSFSTKTRVTFEYPWP